jgi:hypothetical protein
MLQSSSRDEDTFWNDREVEQLERAVNENGELRRGELGRLVGCRYWGPGRFRSALRRAVAEGRIAHTGFGRYGPASK